MSMKNSVTSILILVSGLFLSSCSEKEVPQSEPTAKGQINETESPVVANYKLDLEIDGMVCKMGCGGSIRKELKETGSVEKVEFDFSEERETNFATVYFNSNEITESELVKRISEINEGQFKARAKNTEPLDTGGLTNEQKSEDSNESSVHSYSEPYTIPNLFDLISELLL